MRDASGGESIRALVRDRLGAEIRIVSGDEEARLTFRGALSGLRVDATEDVAVFDIGGGSTEVVVGRAGGSSPPITCARSFDVGSVRLTERHVAHDPPTEAEIEQLRRAARAAFATVPPLPGGRVPVGVAGTMTTLAAVSLGLEPYDGAQVHGHTISKRELDAVVARLASTALASRRRMRGMEPKRADIIVAGGILAQSLLERWQADAVIVSDRGVRWGLAEELV
jgi:exopolyphosphatase/guanosine-5'-triphosphate,3'-diphosphate pyrophosphatase